MTEQTQREVRRLRAARQWHYASVVMAAISGLVCVLLAVVLFANDLAAGSLDIRNSVEMQKAAEQLGKHADDGQYARRIEELDLAIRKDYAVRQELARKAKLALLVSLGVFLVSAGGAVFSRQSIRLPAPAGDRDVEKVRENMLGRWAVLFCSAVVVAVGVAAVFSVRPWKGKGGLVETEAPPEWPGENWPAFRGPDGSGVCNFKNIPTAWNEKQRLNILWKAPVPLMGASSPVVWGDRVFLTAATKQVRKVLCYDANTGKLLWERQYSPTGANNDIDVMQDYIYAAGTCVVDGQRVAAVFANGDVVCFDLEGKELWAKNMGDTKGNQYGYSSSLAMYRDRIIVQFDGDEQHALAALDARTGSRLWWRERQDKSWASPVVVRTPAGGGMVIVCGAPTVSAWDAETGKLIWQADLFVRDAACLPILAAGKVIAVSDQTGMFAIRPDGKGDVKGSHVAWKVGKDDLKNASFPDASSPVSDGRFIYVYMSTMLVCIDAETGQIVYMEDVKASASFASPAIAGGKLYLFAGRKTLIVQPGEKFKLLGTCELDESFDASPAFKDGRIFIRGHNHLYCIGEKK